MSIVILQYYDIISDIIDKKGVYFATIIFQGFRGEYIFEKSY